MKLKFPLFLLIITSLSCSSVKTTQKALNYGNYDEAINIAVKNLRNNKTKKSNQPYITMLQNAFEKVTERDVDRIDFLNKQGDDSNLEEIYNLFTNLNRRQDLIKPLLPLYIIDQGKNATFNFTNYSTNLISAKNNLSAYLYATAKSSLEIASNKYDFRNIYDDLNYLKRLNPNYQETNAMIEEAHFNGTDFVLVAMLNDSDKIIPKNLEKDLLNFDTYNLNNLWTVYHNNKQQNIDYNYRLEIYLREINISPERVNEKEFERIKKIKDGWEYVKDDNGNVVKDSTGTDVKVDVFINVKGKLKVVTQSKSTQVVGVIKYYDLANNQVTNSYPLSSEFIFENQYAILRGDKRALDKNDVHLVNTHRVPFPTNEQMVFDSGENLKQKIKRTISSHQINR